LLSRARDDIPIRREPRAVTWTVPRPLRWIPGDDAAQVGAGGGQRAQRAVGMAIGGDFRPAVLDDLSFAGLHRPERLSLRPGKPRAHQVIGIVGVLLDVVPHAATYRGSMGIKQLRPWIPAFGDCVG